jgi:aspartate-semialdehyde dehydrogenase
VPVFYGHSEAVWATFDRALPPARALDLLRGAPGVLLFDGTDPEKPYPTPMDAAGYDATCVGRVRQDPTNPQTLCLWVVADNVRKGAATNAIQIAEILIRGRKPR